MLYDDVRKAESPKAALMEFLQIYLRCGGRIWANGTANLWNAKEEKLWPRNAVTSNTIKVETTKIHVCPECVKMGDTWVHFACAWSAAT